MTDKIELDGLKIYLGIKLLATDHRERWREMGQWRKVPYGLNTGRGGEDDTEMGFLDSGIFSVPY